MSERVTMPALGESVTEGTVTRWLKNVGDTRRGRRAAARGLDRQGRHRDPLPRGGHAAGDPRPGGRHRPRRRRPRRHRRRQRRPAERWRRAASSRRRSRPEPSEAPEAQAQAEQAPPAEAPSTEQEPQQPATSEPEARSRPQGSRRRLPAAPVGGDGQTVTMPALGESVTEGTVTRWLKAEGDEVAVDEPLLEVSTDKVDTEIPSPVAGTLTKILVQEDETVPVGADLAVIGGAGGGGRSGPPQQAAAARAGRPGSRPSSRRPQPEQAPSPQPAPAPEQPAAAQAAPQEAAPQPPAASRAERARAAAAPEQPPAARRRRATTPRPTSRRWCASSPTEHGVDLGSLTGTGVGGRIRKQDVLDAAEAARRLPSRAGRAGRRRPLPRSGSGAAAPSAPAASPKRGTTEKMSRLRKVIAQRMVESLQVSAQLTTVVEVDVTRIARLRDPGQGRLRARARAPSSASCRSSPWPPSRRSRRTRRSTRASRATRSPTTASENLGIAVDTEQGLLVPVDQERRRPQHRRPGPRRSPTSPTAPATTRSRPTSSPAAPSR